MHKYILRIINSKIDAAGNCYYAFQFEELKTGKVVTAKYSGGESNAYGILQHWNNANGWDRSIKVVYNELSVKDFDKYVKDLPYAGCKSEDLAKWIRSELAKL